MNEYSEGFILGLVQGLTEFLPVSSSGHLALCEKLGVGEESLFFNLALHLATLLAVAIFFRGQIFEAIKHPLSPYSRFIWIATVPTAISAGAIRYCLPKDFVPLRVCFFLTSVLLLLPRFFESKPWDFEKKGLAGRGILVGVFQGVACLNGVSRSGATVSALCLAGVSPEKSAEMSFLLSIPIIIGSGTVEIMTGGGKHVAAGPLILGSLTAFAVGLAAIKFFLKIMKKRKLWVFSIYTFLMAAVTFYLRY